MNLKKKLLIVAALFLLSIQGFAIKVDFTGFSDPAAIALMNSYVSQYTDAVDPMFGAMANSFAVSNAVQPIFGKPYQNFAIGWQGGVGFSNMSFDKSKGGGETLSEAETDIPAVGKINALTFGAATAPYLTLSLDPLAGIFGMDFFENTDLTLKIFSLSVGERGDEISAKFFNFGLMFRKTIVEEIPLVPVLLSFSGVSFSTGVFYSKNTVYSKIGLNAEETVNVDSGSVKFAATDTDLTLSVKSFSLDGDIKAYVNLLYLFDLYAGVGLSVNMVNQVSTSGKINGNLTAYSSPDGGGAVIETSNGGLTLSGDGKGSIFVPRFMFGTQLNIWVLKIGAQYSVALAKDTIKNLTFGVSVAF